MRLKVTAPAVKDMLKPMYTSRHISKDVFKVPPMGSETQAHHMKSEAAPRCMASCDILKKTELKPHAERLYSQTTCISTRKRHPYWFSDNRHVNHNKG